MAPQISFTFILPLFPKLLEFYRNIEAPTADPESKTLLASILGYLNAYKAAFARPIDSRYDIVLLGGALGSLFSCVPPRPLPSTLSWLPRVTLLTALLRVPYTVSSKPSRRPSSATSRTAMAAAPRCWPA